MWGALVRATQLVGVPRNDPLGVHANDRALRRLLALHVARHRGGVGIVATKCIDTLECCGVLLLHLRQLYKKKL